MEETPKTKQVHFLPLARLLLLISVAETEVHRYLTLMHESLLDFFSFNEETEHIWGNSIFHIVINYSDVMYNTRGKIPICTSEL